MGVPALFRWLSKKYPKIIYPVVEEEEVKVPDAEGDLITLPLDITRPNPNETEFDNLYLDMNGIVHPCTHPEGKPAPETEEEMMLEIFSYTERIVSMVRPRKLLFMAIDGVAPRAKMNQQRSRRFRSSQEAKDKEEARKEAVAMWEAMGKTLSEDEKNKKSWDTNAITPGTSFMDLLATSLRYWVVSKMNSDPGWKDLEILISDASVPGEGEHKIMDYIRRQRSNPGHDPNTQHVIYGLDADLIMLSLATHEPNFRVLREDVFQDSAKNACRICGEEGHYAAQCTGTKKEVTKAPQEKKPFIFLDVAVLREYLEVELNVPQQSFPFNLEQAIDDWVLMIFFVGNDFLPHMPSLEIREGAIDTLMRIWRDELPRMGGYLTDHGQAVLSRMQIILEGLARREDEIFRKRREHEERQAQNAKRRKIDSGNDVVAVDANAVVAPSPSLNLTAAPAAPTVHPLPPRPDFGYNADSIGFGGPVTTESQQNAPLAAQALGGSNRDVVANRRAIRMANMSAADVLKAELAGLVPLKPSSNSLPPKPAAADSSPPISASATSAPPPPVTASDATSEPEVPGLNVQAQAIGPDAVADGVVNGDVSAGMSDGAMNVDGGSATNGVDGGAQIEDLLRGVKRTIEEVEEEDRAIDPDTTIDDADSEPADEDAPVSYAMKVNPDGSVDQEDVVKLWEPGYKDRYYMQKFGVPYSDTEFRKKVAKAYIEGICWVLQYYYQGTPSWQWYYPFHFAPFAADFEDIDRMDIKFNPGQPFKPFEQLMGVFPPASRPLIPEAFHGLMTSEDSPILDFYPSSFEVDMNGKKMLWQGVALLPFIEEKRLLEAMAPHYAELKEDELRRNAWGNNTLYVHEDHPLYPFLEVLYGKRKQQDPVPLDVKLSKGMNGSVIRNPDCIPGSTFEAGPLASVGLPDIPNDKSISVLYLFPKQLVPHRSVLLPGVRRPQRTLTSADLDAAQRRGGRGGGLGGYRGDYGGGRGGRAGYDGGRSSYGGPGSYNDRGGGYRGDDRNGGDYQRSTPRPPPPSYQNNSYSNSYGGSYQPPPRQSYTSSQQGYNVYGYGNGAAQNRGGYNAYGSGPRGAPPRGGGQYGLSGGRGSYNGGAGRGGGYNSGGGGGGGGGGYGGQGGYGGHTGAGGYDGHGGYGGGNSSAPSNGYNGYRGGGRGGRDGNSYNSNPSRGRGGGWY